MKQKNNKPTIWNFLSPYKGVFACYLLLSILAASVEFLRTIVAAQVIVKLTQGEYRLTIYISLVVLALSILNKLLWWLMNFIYFKYSNKIMSDLSLKLATQIFKLNSTTFSSHDTGTFVMRIVEDPKNIVDGLAVSVDRVMEIVTTLAVLIYVATINVWLSLSLVFVLLCSIGIECIRIYKRKKNKANLQMTYDTVHSMTTELVRSEKDIKALGLESELSKVSRNKYEQCRDVRYKLDMSDNCLMWVKNLFMEIGIAACLILGIYLTDLGFLTVAAFMIIYSNKGSLPRLIECLAIIANFAVDMRLSAKRMFALFDEEEFVTEKFGNDQITNIVGEIEFKNVGFSYKECDMSDPDANIKDNKIFENLSFKINPNSTVAFVGKSGSGKSTILNLISKIYECDSGQILIDGVDIKDLSKETLRSSISLVNQFPYIFDMTIKNNLLLAKGDATDDEIRDAIKRASLEEFVNSLPSGVETYVGESGIKLSGGQKQRLAIARALLRKSSIIIFDESTSSLDNFAQEDVKKSIDELKGKSTIIVVAHRLSTIKDADHIFFLDGGQIVDEGTFEQLFKHNKKFKAMFLAENI